MIICAGEIESFDFAKAIGIGLEDVAINLTKLVINNNINEILFIGTAGSYGKYGLFDIVESSSSSQYEHSYLLDHSYSPIENQIVSHETDVIVNSSNYITTDENIAKIYLKKNIFLENMEFYSVLKVAKHFGIKAKGMFIVTNFCNKSAHKEFIKNHKEAMNKLSDYVRENY